MFGLKNGDKVASDRPLRGASFAGQVDAIRKLFATIAASPDMPLRDALDDLEHCAVIIDRKEREGERYGHRSLVFQLSHFGHCNPCKCEDGGEYQDRPERQ